MEEFTSLTSRYFDVFLQYLPNIIAAIVIFLLGLWVIKILTRYLRKLFERREMEDTLKNFLLNIINVGLKILLVIMVIAKLGVETTSFIAVMGAAGLAVGMALQGSLANFAGGVLIIVLKPFKVGDYIIANGMAGTVKEVSIFYTTLINDNKLRVVIPNGELSNKTVTNVSAEGQRMDLIGIYLAHGSDVSKARKALIDLMLSQEGTFDNPKPAVSVSEVSTNGIKVNLTFTSKSGDFWRIHYAVLEGVEPKLKEVGVKLASNYLDVKMPQS